MLPDDVIVISASCPPPWMPMAPLPVVMMSAVERMVTVLVSLEANMPFASVAKIANGPVSTFSSTAPVLVN